MRHAMRLAAAIPLAARILCLADAYDAMTSRRPYRKVLDPEAAVEEVRRCAGSPFDPAVARVLREARRRVGRKLTARVDGVQGGKAASASWARTLR